METTTTRTREYSWEDPFAAFAKGRAMGGLEYIKAMIAGKVPPPPIALTMGMNIVEVEKGRAVFSITPQEFHYNPIGSVHGGVFCTILDSAMGCALHTALPLGTGYTTLELKTNFLRPLTTKTGPVTCEGTIINLGKKVALAEATLKDAEGRLYAHATCTCLIFSTE